MIDEELEARVKQLAGRRHTSPNWIMREAITQYIEREETLDSFSQEALASWVAYQENGRHLTAQDLQLWLATWGTDDEKAAPDCRE